MERLVYYRQPLSVGEFRTLPTSLKIEYLDLLFDLFISTGKVIEFAQIEQGVFIKEISEISYWHHHDLPRSQIEKELEKRIVFENGLIGQPPQKIYFSLETFVREVIKLHEKHYSRFNISMSELVTMLIPIMARKKNLQEALKMAEENSEIIVAEPVEETLEQPIASPKKRTLSEEHKKRLREGRRAARQRAAEAKEKESEEKELEKEPEPEAPSDDVKPPAADKSPVQATIHVSGASFSDLLRLLADIYEQFSDDPRGKILDDVLFGETL